MTIFNTGNHGGEKLQGKGEKAKGNWKLLLNHIKARIERSMIIKQKTQESKLNLRQSVTRLHVGKVNFNSAPHLRLALISAQLRQSHRL